MSNLQNELNMYNDQGRDALIIYHNENVVNFPEKYKVKSVDELISILKNRPNQKNFVRILGGAIINAQVSNSQVNRSMEKLSEAGEGRIPADNSAFLGAIQEKIGEVNYVDAIGFAALETAKGVAEGAAKVGDAVISIGDTLLESSKILVPIAAIFVFYAYTRRVAGR